MRAVATAPGAALVHCAANGQDPRPGWWSRWRSARPGSARTRWPPTTPPPGSGWNSLLGRLRRSPTYARDVKQHSTRPGHRHQPQASTMAAFLDQLTARYGGATAWLAGHGFGADELGSAARQAGARA